MKAVIQSLKNRFSRRAASGSLAIFCAMGLAAVIASRPIAIAHERGDNRDDRDNESAQVARLHDLHADFHEAQSYNADPVTRAQHRQLMSELWADDATLIITDANIQANGLDQIMAFWDPRLFPDNAVNRVSLSPAFKTQIEVNGKYADIYFECHIVDPATDRVLSHRAFNATAKKVHGRWVFQDVEIGPASL